jgi:hypothetical protein
VSLERTLLARGRGARRRLRNRLRATAGRRLAPRVRALPGGGLTGRRLALGIALDRRGDRLGRSAFRDPRLALARLNLSGRGNLIDRRRLGARLVGHRHLRGGCPVLGRARRQQLEGIAIVVIRAGHTHAEVEVRRLDGPLPGHPDGADPVPGRDLGPPTHIDRREMEVRGVEAAVSRTDRDQEARRPERPGVPDGSGRRRPDRVAHLAGDVDPPVLAGGERVVAVAVGGKDVAVDRPRPVTGGGGRRGEWQEEG